MYALLQRVNYAKVRVDGKITGEIDKGILVALKKEIPRRLQRRCLTRS